jgi:S1-C subfamily serine protease
VALQCTPGAVTGVATAIATGPAGGMPSIGSSTAAASVAAGDPLLNASGDVVGILYSTNPGSAGPATFLPSQLVVGVADDLRSRNRVVPGWLGVAGSDAPNGGGAKVETVSANSPAEGKLAVGQVIVGVNAMPVRTMAELRARLYVLAPGAGIAVSIQQTAGTKVVDLILGGSS